MVGAVALYTVEVSRHKFYIKKNIYKVNGFWYAILLFVCKHHLLNRTNLNRLLSRLVKPYGQVPQKRSNMERLVAKYGACCMNPNCIYRGKPVVLTLDHVIPKSKGGRNHIKNLQLLCLRCNGKKGDTTVDYRPE